jgi:hypothetical protein
MSPALALRTRVEPQNAPPHVEGKAQECGALAIGQLLTDAAQRVRMPGQVLVQHGLALLAREGLPHAQLGPVWPVHAVTMPMGSRYVRCTVPSCVATNGTTTAACRPDGGDQFCL